MSSNICCVFVVSSLCYPCDTLRSFLSRLGGIKKNWIVTRSVLEAALETWRLGSIILKRMLWKSVHLWIQLHWLRIETSFGLSFYLEWSHSNTEGKKDGPGVTGHISALLFSPPPPFCKWTEPHHWLFSQNICRHFKMRLSWHGEELIMFTYPLVTERRGVVVITPATLLSGHTSGIHS